MFSQSAVMDRTIPEHFREVVVAFATRARLNAENLLDGQGSEYKGIGFRLENYGVVDPNGLYVLLDVGEFNEENEGPMCRRLLEMNLIVPAARLGYYAVMPGTSMVKYCMRIDLAHTGAVDLVGGLLEQFSSELDKMFSQLEQAAHHTGEDAKSPADLA